MAIKSETELYEPVKQMLIELGYTVRAEVNHCDIVAYRDGDKEPVIVELKKTFNLQLIFQVLERLKLSESVYAAIEYDPKKRVSTGFSWNDAIRLCRKLGIGLIGVQFYKRKKPAVDILCEPGAQVPMRRSSIGAKRLQNEFIRRSGDYNIGGSTGKKLVTAYRERSLRVALQISRLGPQSPKSIRAALLDPTVATLLRRNVYGWFDRVKRGTYDLTETGREALREYDYVVAEDQIEKTR
jgi:hypothetical protein